MFGLILGLLLLALPLLMPRILLTLLWQVVVLLGGLVRLLALVLFSSGLAVSVLLLGLTLLLVARWLVQ